MPVIGTCGCCGGPVQTPDMWVVCRLGDEMDIVICPGCGENVPHDNNGCPHCGYENGWNGAEGRLMTLRELLAAPSYPERGAMEMNQVCPAFLRRLAEEAEKAHNAGNKPTARSDSRP